jgi:hypothetical protein
MLKKLKALSLGAKLLLMSAFMLLVVVSCYLVFYVADNGGGVSNIKLTNLTSNSVTVTWVTASPAISKVYLSNSDSWPVLTERIGKQSYYDDRDTEQNHEGKFVLKDDAPKEYLTHHVTLRDLNPETAYFFKVGGGVRLFSADDDSFKTSKVTETVSVPDPVYGRIAGMNNLEPTDGLVSYHIFVLDGEQEVASGVFSTTVSKDSTWSGDLGLAYQQFSALKKNVAITDTNLWVEVNTELGKATYKFPLTDYKPLPDIFLHQGNEESTNQSSSTGLLPLIESVSAAKSRCEETYNENCSNGGVKSCHKIGVSEGGVSGPGCTWGPDSRCGECSTPNSPNPTTAPAAPNTGGSCLVAGCTTGSYWIGGSGQCRMCQGGCTVAVPNTSIPQCCDLMTPSDPRRAQNGCPGAPAPTTAPQEPGTTPAPASGNIAPGPASFTCGNYTNGQHWIGAATRNCNICENGAGHPAANQSLCCDNSDALSSELKARYGCSAGTGNGTGNHAGNTSPVGGIASPWVDPTSHGVCSFCPPTMQLNTCPGSRLVGGGQDNANHKAFCTYELGTTRYTLRFNYNDQCGLGDDDTNGNDNFATISACNAQSSSGHFQEVAESTTGGTTDVGVTVIPAAQCPASSGSCTGGVPSQCTNGGSISVSGPSSVSGHPGYFFCEYTLSKTSGSVSAKTFGKFNDGCSSSSTSSPDPELVQDTLDLNSVISLCGSNAGQAKTGPAVAVLGDSTTATTVSAGIYEVTGTGILQSTITIANDNTIVKFFNDTNSDGVKQDSEPYLDSASFVVKLNKTSDISGFNLINGWNLIGLDSVSIDYGTAFKLLSQINQQGGSATHAAIYVNGTWQIFSVRLDETGVLQKYGNDFNIVPGEGIFIKTSAAGAFNLTGQKFAESVPVNLTKGWNLVSVQSPTKYTAASLLEKCSASQIQCDTVSRFDSARYENLVKTSGTVFGNDFNLVGKSGYFVRLTEGSGQLKP